MRSRSELSNDEDPCMANKHAGKTAFNIRGNASYIHKKMPVYTL